jgi:FkbM family methyltransferase
MRHAIWESCRDRKAQVPIVIGWYLGTRLQLHLGNDLSRQIYTAGCIDPNEFAFLDRYLQPGMTFVDAGANEGIYTVFAAKRVGAHGTVWAFEPSQRELDRLRATVDLNALPDRANVRLFRIALADRNGDAELTIAGFENAGHNTLGAFAYEGIATEEKQTVDLRRLDDVVAENPPARIDVIKMDVEGAELKLLTGAVSTLRQYRPVLLLEVSQRSLSHQGSSQEELLAFLRSNDYSLYVFDDSGLPAPAAPGTYADNMLALPQGMTLPPAVFQLWPPKGDRGD